MLQKNHAMVKNIVSLIKLLCQINFQPILIDDNQFNILCFVGIFLDIIFSSGKVSNIKKDNIKLMVFIPKQNLTGNEIKTAAPSMGPKDLEN
jgi:hypothetical protein